MCITLVTLGLLALRWVLFQFIERKADGPSSLWFMPDPSGHPHDARIRAVVSVLFLMAAGTGVICLG